MGAEPGSAIKNPKSSKVPAKDDRWKIVQTTKRQLSLIKDQFVETERLIRLKGSESLQRQEFWLKGSDSLQRLCAEKDKEASVAILAKEVERQWTMKASLWKSLAATKVLVCLAKARKNALHEGFLITKPVVEAATSELAEVLTWLPEPAYDYDYISEVKDYVGQKYEAAAETLRIIKEEVHLWNTEIELLVGAMTQEVLPRDSDKSREVHALKKELHLEKQWERKLMKDISLLTAKFTNVKAEVERADKARKAAKDAAEQSLELRVEGTPTLPKRITHNKKRRHSTKRPGILIATVGDCFWYYPTFDEIPHPFPKEWVEEEHLKKGVVELYNENVKLMYTTGTFKFSARDEDAMDKKYNVLIRDIVVESACYWYKRFKEWREDYPKATFSHLVWKNIKAEEIASKDIVESDEDEDEEPHNVLEAVISRVTCDAHAEVTAHYSLFEKGETVSPEEPFYDKEMARVVVKLNKLRDRMKETCNRKMRMELHKKVNRAEMEFTKLFKSRQLTNASGDVYAIYSHPHPDMNDPLHIDMLYHLLTY